MVFLGGSDGKESACQAGDSSSIPGLGRSPGEGKWQLTLVFLPGESHGQRSLAGYSPWGRRWLGGPEHVQVMSLPGFYERRPRCLVVAACSLVSMLLQAEVHSPRCGHRGCVPSCPLRAAEDRLAFPSRQHCWQRRGAVLRVHGADQGAWGRQDPPPLPRGLAGGAVQGPGLGGENGLGKNRVQGPSPHGGRGRKPLTPLPGGPGMWKPW